MDKLRLTLIVTAIAVVLALLSVVFGRRIPPKDRNGNTPQVVAREFVGAVNAKDYDLAASHWRPSDVQNLEANANMRFPMFCADFIECDSYRLTPVAWQKAESFLVQFEGEKAGRQKAFALYLKQIDGEWKLVMNKWILD